MGDLRVDPIGIGSSIMYAPQIAKSKKLLEIERAKRDEKEKMERFLEREENFRRSLPDWLGQYINKLV
jgi:hypothetical protein